MKLWPTLGVAFLLLPHGEHPCVCRGRWAGRTPERSAGQRPEKHRRHPEYHQHRVQDMQQVLAQLRVENQQRNRTERPDVNSYATILQKMNAQRFA